MPYFLYNRDYINYDYIVLPASEKKAKYPRQRNERRGGLLKSII